MPAVRGRGVTTLGGFLTPVFVTGSSAPTAIVILSVQGRDGTLKTLQGRNDVDLIAIQGRDDTLIAVEGRSD